MCADIFMANNKNLLCIVDYYRHIPSCKEVASLSADDLVHAIKMAFMESGLYEKITFDAGTSYT